MQDHGREHVKQNKLHKQKEVEFIAISLKTPMFQVEKSSKWNCQIVPLLASTNFALSKNLFHV